MTPTGCGEASRCPSLPVPASPTPSGRISTSCILLATESRVEADLELGHHNELVGELEALYRDHPLRERLWELLMLALHRAGRRTEASRAYSQDP